MRCFETGDAGRHVLYLYTIGIVVMSEDEEHGVIKAMKTIMAAQEAKAQERHEKSIESRANLATQFTQVATDVAAVKVDVKDLGEKITDQRVDMATMGEKVKSAKAIAEGANKKAQAALLGIPLAEAKPRAVAAAKRHAPGVVGGGVVVGVAYYGLEFLKAFLQSQ